MKSNLSDKHPSALVLTQVSEQFYLLFLKKVDTCFSKFSGKFQSHIANIQFEVKPIDSSSCQVRQTAIFDPIGLMGLAYWYGLYPVHQYIFSGMLRNIVKAIESKSA